MSFAGTGYWKGAILSRCSIQNLPEEMAFLSNSNCVLEIG